MVTTQDHGERDRYGHWFPPFEPVAAPGRAAPPAPEPPAPDAPPSPDPTLGAEGGQAPDSTPDYKAPAAADDPFASRDAPTPTWLAADDESAAAVSPKKRKARPPKAPKEPKAAKTPKASPAPTAPPQPPAAEASPTIAEPAPYSEPPQKKSKRPILIGALGAAAALAVGAVVIAVASSPGMLGSDGSAGASGPTTTTAAAAAAVDDYCIESTDGNTITSNRLGDQSSGPNVILAFEYAYYVERDGEQAYALAAPGALAVEADDIQDGIDQAPVDTDYCATITETAPDRFTLDLAVRMSPTSDEKYTMYITTTEIDGKSFITRMGSTP